LWESHIALLQYVVKRYILALVIAIIGMPGQVWPARAMAPNALADDRGQSNIDFLFGLIVLLLTFTYAATFIPGLFLPYQPGAIDLSSVAYRTSAILAEDPGWYSRGAINGTAWEDNVDDISRIGLADDKDHPNVISIEKANKLKEIITADPSKYNEFRHSMGLDGSVVYDFNIVVDMYNTITGQHLELVNVQSPNAGSPNVESIDRNIMVDTGEQLFVDCNNITEVAHGTGGTLYINISSLPTRAKDITIRFYNFTAAMPVYLNYMGIPIGVSGDTGAVMPLSPDDYIIKKNGVVMTTVDFPFMAGDTLEVTYKSSAISDPMVTNVVIESSSTPFPGRPVDYRDDPAYKLKKVYYPGTMKLEVWSHAFV
jgi:hypothetical protein